MNNILTVTLNPAIDRIVEIPSFSIGRDFYEGEILDVAGGKGINVSRVLKRLGVSTFATGLYGGATGQKLIEKLKAEGISNRFLRIPNETRINLTIIDPINGKTTRVLQKGPRVALTDIEKFKQQFRLIVKQFNCIVISGRSVPGHDNVYVELIKITQREGVKVALDTSGQVLKSAIDARPFLIKPNLQEAESVLSKKLTSMTQLKQALQFFLKKGIEVVIISLGERGAVAANDQEMVHVSASKVKSINFVGCGDALLAGFLAKYKSSNNFKNALMFGVAAASAYASNMTFSTAQINKLLKMIQVKSL